MASVADGGATIILIKRWVALIVIIIMQPCLWNANYAIMYGQIIQESSNKSANMSLKKVVDHKMLTTCTNDHLKFLRYLFLFHPY